MASEMVNDTVAPNVNGADESLQPVNADTQVMTDAIKPPVESTDVSVDDEMHDSNTAPPNQEAFDENRTVSSSAKLDTTDALAPGTNPGGPTPTEDASSGIAPVADFIPKDAPNLSHPTPPPEQSLGLGEVDVDTEMQDQPTEEPTSSNEKSRVASVEPSQPQTAVESTDAKPEESLLNGVSKSTEPPSDADATADGIAGASTHPIAETSADVSADAKPVIQSAESPQESTRSDLVRAREDDGDDEPAAKRAKVDETQPVQSDVSKAPTPAPAPAPAPVAEEPKTSSARESIPPLPSTETPAAVAKPASVAPTPEHRKRKANYSTTPMTSQQKSFLVDKLKNTKKTKHAVFFLNPVDPIALNIPTYPDVIKHPMDLGTLESKLKADKYLNVQEFADDLQLIVDNAEKFNGPQHAVTHAGNNMLAYTNNFMGKVPGPGQAVSIKKEKKYSPAPPKVAAARREARPPQPAPVKERSNASEAFALQSDGMPQIRRDSQTHRPARAIKPPQNREVIYPKTKRREHLLELKFAEHVLDLIKGPRHARVNHVFLMPVDPVALNIPTYRQVVKNPMDLSTMTQKMKQGMYSKAAEVKKDFDLMIENCLIFNPIGNPVRDLGIEFRRELEALWRGKDKWERDNKPRSERASSESGDDSGADESEEDEAPADDNAATIEALSKQLAMIQNQLAGFNSGAGKAKAAKSKKAKDVPKPSKKKSLPPPMSKPAKPAPASKSRPKKQKPVTYEEKQEISSAVEKMDGAQIEKLTQIITENCEKYRNMGDEMELEIDDLPDDVQRLLLKHVRGIFGNPNRAAERAASPDDLAAADDDDFEPSHRSRGGGGGGDAKRKKHKPMGKKEQQDSINNLRSQLAAFHGGIPAAEGESPTSAHYAGHGGDDDESSDDEESEEE